VVVSDWLPDSFCCSDLLSAGEIKIAPSAQGLGVISGDCLIQLKPEGLS
jgi:hypothetical protein